MRTLFSALVFSALASPLALAGDTGKVAIGGTAYWSSSRAAVQFFLEPSLSGGTAYTDGIATDDLLNVQLICVAAN